MNKILLLKMSLQLALDIVNLLYSESYYIMKLEKFQFHYIQIALDIMNFNINSLYKHIMKKLLNRVDHSF